MKTKFIATLVACAAVCGYANAVTVSVIEIANTSVGLITAGASPLVLTGTSYLYTSTNDLTAAQLASFTATTTAGAQASFAALLTGPVQVRSDAFTAGILGVNQPATVDQGAFTYLFMASADGNYYGIFQGPTIPSGGSVIMNPATMLEDLKGTSTAQTVTGVNSGWQLVSVVPEPSAALLGMLGAFGLLRRRR